MLPSITISIALIQHSQKICRKILPQKIQETSQKIDKKLLKLGAP